MIYSFHAKQEPELLLKNMKSFTAIKLIRRHYQQPKKSSKEYILNLFEVEGKKSSSNQQFKFWEHENHPVFLDSDLLYNQKFIIFIGIP